MKSRAELTSLSGDTLKSTPEADFKTRREELRLLENGYECELAEKPRWCVYGKDQNQGKEKVVYWIRPLSNDEFVAHRMAYLLSHTGGTAKAHMTEWNENLIEEPVYGAKLSL